MSKMSHQEYMRALRDGTVPKAAPEEPKAEEKPKRRRKKKDD